MASPVSRGYETWRGLPELAGLTSMDQCQRANWSVEESVSRLKRLHFMLRRMYEIFTSRITAEPIYELKTAYSRHAWLCATQVSAVRRRVGEMREPPLGLDQIPGPSLQRFFEEAQCAPDSAALVWAMYEKAVPAARSFCRRLFDDAHPLADAPTRHLVRHALLDLDEIDAFGRVAVERLLDDARREALSAWAGLLDACLENAAGADSAEDLPAPLHSREPYRFDPVPQRDERFIDPYNAGVNPEAFLYDERFSARDKTLMMYYKRLREIDVPEMMASIQQELNDEPWEFHEEMSRQLWDEARHAMMGEVGFASLGIDWRSIPINFTWSRNLNTQLTARERHGVLFYIEQGLMPKTGKRYEWEVGRESGDPLSALFQDFDWADEVLHSQIGRRWYVPRFASLNDALAYGDRCWSKVLSQWREFLDQGLTEHRNWWPEIYQQACAGWGVSPDPDALAFATTYEETRADLKAISASG